MPVYSMTGYASVTVTPATSPETVSSAAATADAAQRSVEVEIRSVNSRFLDLSFRLPDELRSLEPHLRELVGQSVHRGKVELRVHATSDDACRQWPQPTTQQLSELASLQSRVQTHLQQAAPLSVDQVMHWCQSHRVALPQRDTVLAAVRKALAQWTQARAREGEKLIAVLYGYLEALNALVVNAEPVVTASLAQQKEKFMARWAHGLALHGALSHASPEQLQERAIQEVTAFAIRTDIAEELSRLEVHLNEIRRLLHMGGEVGKRIDFLIQELLREANTVGSKAGSTELTQISLEMKVLIERLREQVQNLE